MDEIKTTDLSAWIDDETYGIEAANVADVLNMMLARIKALEEKVNAITIGPGGALYGS